MFTKSGRTRHSLAFLGALFLGLSASSPPAQAQTQAQAQSMCGNRADVINGLEKSHSEQPVSMGLTNNGSVVEVLASDDGSFTIITTHPNGMSCLMAAGDVWETLPLRKAGAKI